MPKELTHWLIATDALSTLEEGSRLKEIISRNLDYYLLGAVIYDTPYSFPEFTSNQKEFKKIADTLHGVKGDDVFQPFKNIILEQKEQTKEELLAFSVGFLSHVIVDTNFHPLVYFLTGNYYSEDKNKRDKAVSNHRWLETNIDMWFMDKFDNIEVLKGRKYLKAIVKGIDNLEYCLGKLAEAIPLDNIEKGTENYKKGVSYHSFFQKFLFIRLIRALLSFFLGNEHKTVALFYPPENNFNGGVKITYHHPVTGEKRETTLEQLQNSTREKLAKTLQDLNEVLFSENKERGIDQFIADLPARSLETGMYRAKSTDMNYFAKEFKREDWITKGRESNNES